MDKALTDARRHLATAYFNQVGVEWDECLESADLFVTRNNYLSRSALLSAIYAEAERYEDM